MTFFRRLHLALRAFWLCLWYGDHPILEKDREFDRLKEENARATAHAAVVEEMLFDEFPHASEETYDRMRDEIDRAVAIRLLSNPPIPEPLISALTDLADAVEQQIDRKPGLSDWIDTTRHGEP